MFSIYINPEKSPAALTARPNGAVLSNLRLKRGATVPLTVVVLGDSEITDLRFGVKLKNEYEEELLIFARSEQGEVTDEGTAFQLLVQVASANLDSAFGVGSGQQQTPATLAAICEFGWVEDGTTRLSETLSTVILNDIIRMPADYPHAGDTAFPAAELIATKEWVTGEIENLFAGAEELRTYKSVAGNSNANFRMVEIPAYCVRAGKLQEVTMPGRIGGDVLNTDPLHLVILEQVSGAWVWRGTSINTATQQVGQSCRWTFADAPLAGGRLRVLATAANVSHTAADADAEKTPLSGRVLVVSAAEDGCVENPNAGTGWSNFLAELHFSVLVGMPGRVALGEHVEDEVAHLSKREHDSLTALLARKDELLALLN